MKKEGFIITKNSESMLFNKISVYDRYNQRKAVTSDFYRSRTTNNIWVKLKSGENNIENSTFKASVNNTLNNHFRITGKRLALLKGISLGFYENLDSKKQARTFLYSIKFSLIL